MMLDLFDTPILPGLAERPDIIDRLEEQRLIRRIDKSDLTQFRFLQQMRRLLAMASIPSEHGVVRWRLVDLAHACRTISASSLHFRSKSCVAV